MAGTAHHSGIINHQQPRHDVGDLAVALLHLRFATRYFMIRTGAAADITLH
eukprot:COSAG01_NODE_32715_length_576_cov_9.658281_1_plen_50_part_01